MFSRSQTVWNPKADNAIKELSNWHRRKPTQRSWKLEPTWDSGVRITVWEGQLEVNLTVSRLELESTSADVVHETAVRCISQINTILGEFSVESVTDKT